MVMKYLQRLGKSLMLPIACLPVCAILMGIGYAIDENVMSGLADPNVVALFLVKAGGALIDNMGILFAIGIAVGMSDDGNGAAALAGLVSWLVVTTLCSTGVATALVGGVFDDLSAFAKISNQFIGILTGLIGAHCYNFFKNTKLPAALAFFSGKRSVSIVAAGVSLLVSVLLLFIWPFLFTTVLVGFGKIMADIGPWGAGLYGFFNRLLIPVGLHHALNSVFWFDVANIADINTFWTATEWVGKAYVDFGGNIIAADSELANTYVRFMPLADVLKSFPKLTEDALRAAGLVNEAGNVAVQFSTLHAGQAGMYQAGFFPIMMFGLPGAALAMYQTAKPENKKTAMGVLGAAALASFLTGVTEPLEFSFMFLAPVLYVAHAVLTGLCVMVVAFTPARSGFWFSAGLTDYIFSALTANSNMIWLLPVIGLVMFGIYYVVFYFMITKLDLKTPGREDDEEEDGEKKVTLANNNFTEVAAVILEGLGGKENVKSLDNCITRLRLEIKDYTKVDEKKIKSAGVAGVLRPGKDSVQVIVGTQVQHVADEMKKML